MSVLANIETKLENVLNLSHIEVINESSNHNVPEGSESHFKVILVSNDFDKLGLLQRHRKVNEILANELKEQIHALAIHTYTDSEWSEQNNQSPTSPPCLGGSK